MRVTVLCGVGDDVPCDECVIVFADFPVAGHRFADADSESYGVVDLLVSAF